jgi:hypothetical protein
VVIGLVVAVTALTGFDRVWAEQAPRTVAAERFVVQDSGGRIRAVLGMDDNGGIGLSLIGAPGALEPGGNAGTIILYADELQAHLRVSIGMDSASPAVVLNARDRDSGRLLIVDEDGDTAVTLP